MISLQSLSLAARTALMVAVTMTAAVVGLTLVVGWMAGNDARKAALTRVDANMRVAWDVLGDYSPEFTLRDGRIYVGSTPLNNFGDPVDHTSALVGGTTAIFMGDQRVALTGAQNKDRARAAPGVPSDVRRVVLQQGRTYRAEGPFDGQKWFMAFDPIRNPAGQVIGMVFTGLPNAEVMAGVHRVQWIILGIGTLLTLIATALPLMLAGRLFAPLSEVKQKLEALQQGRLDIDLPAALRADDIGNIARTTLALRDAAQRRARLEAEETRLREEAEARRIAEDEERQRIAAEDAVVVEALTEGMAALANGDLTHRIEADFGDRSALLKSNYNAAMDALSTIVFEISERVGFMRAGALDTAAATDDLSRRTEQQAAALEQTAAALEQLTETVHRTADGAQETAEITGKARADGDSNMRTVEETTAAMKAIEDSSARINEILGVIDEIAFQTNLLALNAGVEAARAGPAGRGFAVVAAEVRGLAQRSAEAAKEIKTLIGASGANVSEGTRLVARTGEALSAVIAQVVEINTLATGIATSAREQSSGLSEIHAAVSQMDHTTQQNAVMVEQTTAANQSLLLEAERLAELVAHFRFYGDEEAGFDFPDSDTPYGQTWAA